MPFCGQCGTEVADGVKFCPTCGTPMGNAPEKEKVVVVPEAPGTQNAGFAPSDIEANKVMAILAYLGILWLIPFFNDATKNSPYAQFHIRQGFNLLVLDVAYMVLSAILGFTFLAFIVWLASILILVLCIIGIVNATQGTAKPLPIIGNLDLLNMFFKK